MKKAILPLLSVLVLSSSALFAAETKDTAKEKASCCEEQSSCCNDGAQKKDVAKDNKPAAEKTAETKKS